MRNIFVSLLAHLLFTEIASAHPGRTDSSGCHTQRATGTYHCHGGGTGASSLTPGKAARLNEGSERFLVQNPKPNSNGENFTCGLKQTCREMDSCAEARFYLENCRAYRLDADHDGIPCESICN